MKNEFAIAELKNEIAIVRAKLNIVQYESIPPVQGQKYGIKDSDGNVMYLDSGINAHCLAASVQVAHYHVVLFWLYTELRSLMS